MAMAMVMSQRWSRGGLEPEKLERCREVEKAEDQGFRGEVEKAEDQGSREGGGLGIQRRSTAAQDYWTGEVEIGEEKKIRVFKDFVIFENEKALPVPRPSSDKYKI